MISVGRRGLAGQAIPQNLHANVLNDLENERRMVDDREPAPSGREYKKANNKPSLIKLSHDAYTVGWVCALPKEQTAATAMLD